MRSKTKYLALLLILVSPLLSGQVDNLSLLTNMADSISSGDIEEDTNANSNQDNNTENNGSLDRKKYIDSDYGFTGGKNFQSSQQSKFSEDSLEYFGYDYFSLQTSTYAP